MESYCLRGTISVLQNKEFCGCMMVMEHDTMNVLNATELYT